MWCWPGKTFRRAKSGDEEYRDRTCFAPGPAIVIPSFRYVLFGTVVLQPGLLCWLLQRGFKVSSGTVMWHGSCCGTVSDKLLWEVRESNVAHRGLLPPNVNSLSVRECTEDLARAHNETHSHMCRILAKNERPKSPCRSLLVDTWTPKFRNVDAVTPSRPIYYTATLHGASETAFNAHDLKPISFEKP